MSHPAASHTHAAPSSTSSTNDFILHSLIESGFNPSALKNIFERGGHKSFSHTLQRYIEKQQLEIQNLCNAHYEDFLIAITKLNDTRQSADSLKHNIGHLNQQVQESGHESVQSATNLLRHKTIAQNIESTMRVIRWCRVVAALSLQANHYIQEKQYFHALQTLDSLQRSIHRVRQYSFAQQLEHSIPLCRQQIKDAVSTRFNDWLNTVKKKAQPIGNFLLKHMRNKMNLLAHEHATDGTAIVGDSEYEHEDVFANCALQFDDVYLCKLIYTQLHSHPEFVTYFKKNREVQIDYDLRVLPQNEDFPMHCAWLARIVGFFEVEHHILKTTQDLITEVEFKKLWEKTRTKVENQLDRYFSKTTDPHQFLEMKDVVSCFCFTMSQRMRLDVESLLDLMQKYTGQFSTIVASVARDKMRGIIQHENFCPYSVKSADQYSKLADYNLVSKENFSERIKGIRFPITVPFSQTVPSICETISEYMKQFFQYSQFLTDLDEVIKVGLQQVLQDVDNSFDKLIDETPYGALGHYAHIAVNAEYIIRACTFFEEEYVRARRKNISSASGGEARSQPASRSTSSTIRARCLTTDEWNTRAASQGAHSSDDTMILKIPRTLFAQKRDRAEDRIQKCIYLKIDELIDLSARWEQVTDASMEVHQFADNLAAYLQTTLQTLSILPRDKVEDLTFKCSHHVSNALLDLVLKTELLNMDALKVLKRDIQRIQASLLMYNQNAGYCFAELEHLIGFVLTANLTPETLVTWNEQNMEELVKRYRETIRGEAALHGEGSSLHDNSAKLRKVVEQLQNYEQIRKTALAKQSLGAPQAKKKGGLFKFGFGGKKSGSGSK